MRHADASHRRFRRLFPLAFVAWLLAISVAVAHGVQRDPDTYYNVQSKIYHSFSCRAAKQCTKNCIAIKLSEAIRRGGRACKICGGPTTASELELAHHYF